MKILVDVMPENAAKCKFHGPKCFENEGYMCTVTRKPCPMNEGGSCRVLKPFSECIRQYLR